MLFNSFIFAISFPLLFIVSYLCPVNWRRYFLLLVSYTLYINWVPVYVLILLWVTLCTYTGALCLETDNRKKNRWIMYVVSTLTFLPLFFFKYYDFVNCSLAELFQGIGYNFEPSVIHWAAPIGISFFTFQAYGYLADVYYKRITCERNAVTYALFVSFFPQIASGPISKAKDLIPQFKNINSFDQSKVILGLKLLLWGIFMKVVLADRLGLYVDAVYSNYNHLNGLSCLMASICYSFQIYGDFAGYSLMAIGVAKMLGFDLINNFNCPYLSTSITDFWHRWHISLSIWLRDYVYIPLGGSRCGTLHGYWNILITFLISGIWHGANWTFIVWGIIHGVAQILEKILYLQKNKGNGFQRFIHILATFMVVNLAWIIFRMPTLQDAWEVIRRIFTNWGTTLFIQGKSDILYMAFAVFILMFKEITDEFLPGRFLLFDNRYRIVRWGAYVGMFFLILLVGVLDSGQFIYASF